MPRAPTSPAGLFGVHSGIVVDVKDPDGQGRVKVTLPWSEQPGAARVEIWARLAVPMAGNKRGMWLIPDVDDEVVVAFEGGDARRPIVIGAMPIIKLTRDQFAPFSNSAFVGTPSACLMPRSWNRCR